jgi:hypothetical protein
MNGSKLHGIEVKLECEISGVDPKRRRLILKSGGEFGFNKLLAATGARPRKLSVDGANLGNVYYLRSLDDSRGIRSLSAKVKRAVVIGGGFIGCVGREHRHHGARAHDVGPGERPDRKRAFADAVQVCLHVPSWLYPATPRDSDENEVVRSSLRNGGTRLSSMEAAVPEIRDNHRVRRSCDAERR